MLGHDSRFTEIHKIKVNIIACRFNTIIYRAMTLKKHQKGISTRWPWGNIECPFKKIEYCRTLFFILKSNLKYIQGSEIQIRWSPTDASVVVKKNSTDLNNSANVTFD